MSHMSLRSSAGALQVVLSLNLTFANRTPPFWDDLSEEIKLDRCSTVVNQQRVGLVVKGLMCRHLYTHKGTLDNGSTSKEEDDLDPTRSFFGNYKIELKTMER